MNRSTEKTRTVPNRILWARRHADKEPQYVCRREHGSLGLINIDNELLERMPKKGFSSLKTDRRWFGWLIIAHDVMERCKKCCYLTRKRVIRHLWNVLPRPIHKKKARPPRSCCIEFNIKFLGCLLVNNKVIDGMNLQPIKHTGRNTRPWQWPGNTRLA
jgi:hypothetical protein